MEAGELLTVGREQILGELLSVFSAAAGGDARALVLRGPAGIGRTTLLDRAALLASERGFHVVRARASALERELPFAFLSLLLAGVNETDVELDASLAAATGRLSVASPPSPVAIGTGMLRWLSSLAEDRPVALLIDDVQNCDVSSAHVLGFAIRRLRADTVAVVLTERSANGPRTSRPDSDAAHDPFADIASVELGPLGEDVAIDLLRTGGIDTHQQKRLAIATGGIPALLHEAIEANRSGQDPFGFTRRLESWETFARSVQPELGDGEREVLEVVAFNGDYGLLQRVFGPTLDARLVGPASAGLIRVGASIEFVNRTALATLLGSLTPAAERTVHARIAACLSPQESPDQHALHRAAAAAGHDAEAAKLMSEFAARARAKGAIRDGAAASVRAAALHAPGDARALASAEAAATFFHAGELARAAAHAEAAVAEARSPEIRADTEIVRATVTMFALPPDVVLRRMVAVADEVEQLDGTRASWALITASAMGLLHGDVANAVDLGRRAEALCTSSGNFLGSVVTSVYLALHLGAIGEVEESRNRAATVEPLVRFGLTTNSLHAVEAARMFSTVMLLQERWDEADALLRDVIHSARVIGSETSAMFSDVVRASILARRGRLHEARLTATRQLSNTPELEPGALCWAHGALAQLCALLGMHDEARRYVNESLALARQLDIPLAQAWLHTASGLVALSEGDNDIALAAFDRVNGILTQMRLVDPTLVPFHGDHLESMIRCGHRSDAAVKVEQLAEVAEQLETDWLRGIVARVRGQLAVDPVVAEAHFGDAEKAFTVLGAPTEIARTLLVRGNCRAARNDERATRDWAAARRMFLELELPNWASQVPQPASEPPATSPAVERTTPDELSKLSAAELRVVQSVVAGRANKEVAAELYVSVKTVEFHLQSVYRKLGVRSRTELVARFGRAG